MSVRVISIWICPDCLGQVGYIKYSLFKILQYWNVTVLVCYLCNIVHSIHPPVKLLQTPPPGVNLYIGIGPREIFDLHPPGQDLDPQQGRTRLVSYTPEIWDTIIPIN